MTHQTLVEMREALIRYGRHDADCTRKDFAGLCSCGFSRLADEGGLLDVALTGQEGADPWTAGGSTFIGPSAAERAGLEEGAAPSLDFSDDDKRDGAAFHHEALREGAAPSPMDSASGNQPSREKIDGARGC